jgi:hypothetical protein
MNKECFAYKNNQCRALNEAEWCKDDKACAFYKTKEEQNHSINKAYTRLTSLDKDTQRYIVDKYYNGKYHWKKAGDFNGR